MQLPEEDEAFLNEKGFVWKLVEDGGGTWLLVEGYRVNPARFDRDRTDLLIQIPSQYNIAKLDMWYCDPPVKFLNGGFPNQANVIEAHVGRNWQRFSRHLPDTQWRAGIDGLPLFFTFIARELQTP